MNRRVSLAALVLAVLAVSATVAISTLAQSGTGASLDGGYVVQRGKFDVDLRQMPGEAAAELVNPVKDVTEVRLLNNWAILRISTGLKTYTLVLPRERIGSINMAD